jgi:hypothetical protein
MAKTAAQRQAAYRDRAKVGDGYYRLNGWINMKAHFALKRLAKRYGVTQREVLERLLTDEDNRILSQLDLDSPEWDAYLGA